MPPINYTPVFKHEDWIDNVDRVQAGGSDGFNSRFHLLETEFADILAAFTQIGQLIDTLAVKPPPAPTKISLSPILTISGPQGWTLVNGFAIKPAGQTSAHGILPVFFPDGATIQTFRATGTNAGSGQGILRIALQRIAIGPSASTAQRIARVDGVGQNFDSTVAADSQTAKVDNAGFRYFIAADLDNAQGADNVQLNDFQITIQA